MSVHVISWVLRHSTARLGDRLVLIVLADHAQGDGQGAWPSVETIAYEALISERQARRCLRDLEEMGAIQPTGKTRQGVNVYRVMMEGGQSVRGTSTTEVLHDLSPEPSLEPSYRETPSGVSRNGRPKNPIWDALTEVFGDATTETARSRRGKVCRSLTAAKATPDEILRRARSWPRHFDDATLTEMALEKHWDVLGRKPLRVTSR